MNIKELKIFITKSLNPSLAYRIWEVSCMNWTSGYGRYFWFRENAIKYANSQKELFIDLRNTITEKEVRIKDNPDKVPPPSVYLDYNRGI